MSTDSSRFKNYLFEPSYPDLVNPSFLRRRGSKTRWLWSQLLYSSFEAFLWCVIRCSSRKCRPVGLPPEGKRTTSHSYLQGCLCYWKNQLVKALGKALNKVSRECYRIAIKMSDDEISQGPRQILKELSNWQAEQEQLKIRMETERRSDALYCKLQKANGTITRTFHELSSRQHKRNIHKIKRFK